MLVTHKLYTLYVACMVCICISVCRGAFLDAGMPGAMTSCNVVYAVATHES